MVVPAAFGWYFFGGGKKRIGVWRDRKGKGRAYEKMEMEKA